MGRRRRWAVAGVPAAAACAVLALGLGLGGSIAGASPKAAPQSGGTVEVLPGPNAITNAIAAASSGSTLNIHAGVYNEAFAVNKVLTLQRNGTDKVYIDGQCSHPIVVDASVSGITLDGLIVRGASGPGGEFNERIEIDMSNVSSGTIKNSVVKDTCADGQYGINVYNSGAIQILDNRESGFSDTGIYIGGIQNTINSTGLLIEGNVSFDNERGVILEDSHDTVRVRGHNEFRDNVQAGIYFDQGTDSMIVRNNTVKRTDQVGIWITDNSTGNLVDNNTISGSGDYDIRRDSTPNTVTNNHCSTSLPSGLCT